MFDIPVKTIVELLEDLHHLALSFQVENTEMFAHFVEVTADLTRYANNVRNTKSKDPENIAIIEHAYNILLALMRVFLPEISP